MRSATSLAAVYTILLSLVQPSLADEKPLVENSFRGVHPNVLQKYDPTSSKQFTCLDGSRSLNWSAVNDDYCDCPDGSDEPGTSACEGSGIRFYCENKGHIPGSVLASRVNDGICDPECCDGSDEWATGACPNKCQEIGKEYRTRMEAELKTRKTGAKIRGTYIKWAVGEKKRLEDELRKKEVEVKEKEAEMEKARVSLAKAESRSQEELEKRKQSPLYIALLSQNLALQRLRTKVSRLENEASILTGILEDLSKGYNPNYQDMAVKAAVVGWEEFKNPPNIPDENENQSPETSAPGGEGGGGGATEVAKEEVEEEITDKELDDLERKDLEGLLIQEMEDSENGDDQEDALGGAALLYRIDEYVPDALYDHWETIRDLTINWLVKLGVVGKGTKASPKGGEMPHVAALRTKHRDITNEVNQLNNQLLTTSDTLSKLASNEYGKQGEWKKLDGVCIDTISGDYTYELCFFGRATQKSNKDYSSNHLGTWGEWNTAAPAGSEEYYKIQKYTNGARCWNGPMRSATVDLSCGKENALLQVSEPEKCEYRFRVTSPALCLPLEDSSSSSSVGGSSVKEEEITVKEEL